MMVSACGLTVLERAAPFLAFAARLFGLLLTAAVATTGSARGLTPIAAAVAVPLAAKNAG